MPSMNVVVAHELTRDEATERLRGFLVKVREHYSDKVSNLQEEWGENSMRFAFSAMGFSTSGEVTVEASEVVVAGKIPLAAMMFRGQIETAIRDQLNRVLT